MGEEESQRHAAENTIAKSTLMIRLNVVANGIHIGSMCVLDMWGILIYGWPQTDRALHLFVWLE